MSKKTVDQHDVVNRGWNEADRLAEALRRTLDAVPRKAWLTDGYWTEARDAEAALRRYKEARDA